MVFTHFRKGQGIIAASLCPNGQACHGGCVLGPRCRCKQVTVVCRLNEAPISDSQLWQNSKKKGVVSFMSIRKNGLKSDRAVSGFNECL